MELIKNQKFTKIVIAALIIIAKKLEAAYICNRRVCVKLKYIYGMENSVAIINDILKKNFFLESWENSIIF